MTIKRLAGLIGLVLIAWAGLFSQVVQGPTSLTNAATAIAGGTDGRILRNNAGTLGEYTVNGSGTAVCLVTGCVMVTPTLGVATATSVQSATYSTATNCADSAGAAACGSAAAGSFVVDAAGTSTVVSTTAVTANSQIFVFFDASLSTRLSVTCNATVPAVYGITARTAGTSFTLTTTASVTDPACWNYRIVN